MSRGTRILLNCLLSRIEKLDNKDLDLGGDQEPSTEVQRWENLDDYLINTPSSTQVFMVTREPTLEYLRTLTA